MNDGLLDAGRTLPMWVTGFRPRPWEPASVMLIGKLLSFAGLTIVEQENERLLLELIQLGVDDERLRELFHPYLDGIDFEPLREIRIAKRLSDEALELLADLPRLAGSNAWAVSPARSATGHALLASDPHLEVNRLPPIWYEIALQLGRRRSTRWARRCPAARSWRSAAPTSWPGASRTCTPTRAIFSSRIAGPAARPAGNIAAATAGSISSTARK